MEGATITGALDGTDTMTKEEYQETYPIGGGTAINPSAPDATTNTAENPDAEAEFDATIRNLLDGAVATEGERQLQEFDCTGLNGYHCCLLIKATVKDADTYGNSIQCTLTYVEGTKKKNFMNMRGKKIFVEENQ